MDEIAAIIAFGKQYAGAVVGTVVLYLIRPNTSKAHLIASLLSAYLFAGWVQEYTGGSIEAVQGGVAIASVAILSALLSKGFMERVVERLLKK